MNDLLLLGLSLSLSGSLVAAVLILLRPFLRRFGRTWQYYLWLLVLLRLLIPFSLDVNIVGGLFQQAQGHVSAQSAPTDTIFPFVEGAPSPAVPGQAPVIPSPSPADTPVFAALQTHLWGALWLLVAVILLARKIVAYHRFLHVVKQGSRPICDGPLPAALQTVRAAMGVRRQVCLCTNALVRAPMLIGLVRPMIVLPSETIPPAELTFIFRHELTHARRLDFLYKWLAELAVCLHWFHPLAYWVRTQISQDCEFSCDEAVVADLAVAERRRYGETLLNTIVIGGTDTVSLSLNKDGRLIQERLDAMMRTRRNSKGMALLAALLTSALLCGAVFAGAYPVAAANQTKLNQVASAPIATAAQTVVYEQVGVLRDDGGGAYAYLTNVRTNHTDQKIVSCNRAMLAFDQAGNPLKLDWWTKDDDFSNSHYLWTHGGLTREVPPGQKDEQTKGWRLNATRDPEVGEIAYVLFCDATITFADGTAWSNPNYDQWVATYEGKKVDVDVLKSYYPYEEQVTFGEKVDGDHTQK